MPKDRWEDARVEAINDFSEIEQKLAALVQKHASTYFMDDPVLGESVEFTHVKEESALTEGMLTKLLYAHKSMKKLTNMLIRIQRFIDLNDNGPGLSLSDLGDVMRYRQRKGIKYLEPRSTPEVVTAPKQLTD